MPTNVIFPNSTFVALKLSAWPENGCPLLYFVVQYRVIHDDGDGEWNLVSNALKPQKRFIISNLQPSTMYQLRIEAYNIAGHSSQDFTFVTLTKDGGEGGGSVQAIKARSHTEKLYLIENSSISLSRSTCAQIHRLRRS